MMIAIGVLIGLVLGTGIAFVISSVILKKSNDFGDSTASLEQYTGYDPVEITNQGQIIYDE